MLIKPGIISNLKSMSLHGFVRSLKGSFNEAEQVSVEVWQWFGSDSMELCMC